MSIETLTPGELLTVRIYKSLDTRPDVKWANSYEVRVLAATTTGTGSNTAQALAETLSDFEQIYHLSDVVFDRAVVSSWVEDGVPYNPLSFVSIPFAGKRGAKASTSDALPLQVCLLVRREVLYGRTGRLLYRRALLEGEVVSPAGSPALPQSVQGALASAMNEDFQVMQGALAREGLELVLAARPGFGPQPQVREVVDFEPAGVTIKKFNNRYFDRTG